MTNQQVERSRQRLREQVLLDALARLANEANGFLAFGERSFQSSTNVAVLRQRIDEARAAIAKASE